MKILHMLDCTVIYYFETPGTVTKSVTNFSPTHANPKP